MVTYYVDNTPVLPKVTNFPYNKVRESVDYKPYCNAQELTQLINLVIRVVLADDSFSEAHTGELELTGLVEYLVDGDDFAGWDTDDLDWFVYCVVSALGIV